MNGAAAPAVLLVLSLGSVLGALRCLSERLLNQRRDLIALALVTLGTRSSYYI